MKTYFAPPGLIVTFIILSAACSAQQKSKVSSVKPLATTTITGHIVGLKDSSVTWYWTDMKGESKSISVPVIKERFTWTPALTEPQKVVLRTARARLEIFAEPGHIYIEGNIDSVHRSKVRGSRTQNDYVRYQQGLQPLMAAQNSIIKRFQAAGNDTLLQNAAKMSMDSLYRYVNKYKRTYLIKMPSSPVSVSIVDELVTSASFSQADSAFQMLSPVARRSGKGKLVAERLERTKRSQADMLLKDFELPSVTGEKVQLSSFRGKYVFIDFWASWCGPCRAENPNVLKAYNMYKDKGFTVVGVSMDESKQSWKQAIEKDQMPWTQLSDLKGFNTEIARYYDIKAIPTTLLVDPQGKIIAKDLTGESLHRKLKEIFN